MRERFNWKSITAGLIVLFIGVALILLDLFKWKTDTNLGISIGCSLIASAIVIILTDIVVDRVKENPLDIWGIKQIYHTRAEMNKDCAASLDKAKYQIDVVAFGLKSFRTTQEKLVKRLLQRGVNFRIITMSPYSPFVHQRETEENETEDQIRHTIVDLIAWANDMNKQGYKGKVIVKGYSCMTLDFYWRVDNEIYLGPYWYGRNSQQTISYKFSQGAGFNDYSDHFEELWNNDELLEILTKEQVLNTKHKK